MMRLLLRFYDQLPGRGGHCWLRETPYSNVKVTYNESRVSKIILYSGNHCSIRIGHLIFYKNSVSMTCLEEAVLLIPCDDEFYCLLLPILLLVIHSSKADWHVYINMQPTFCSNFKNLSIHHRCCNRTHLNVVSCYRTMGGMIKAFELCKGQRCKGDPGIGLVAMLAICPYWYL